MAEPFENDESFLGYVEIHSQTPRALFHRDHVFRLFRLAGFSENQLVASDLIPDFLNF
jgi:hypothetical protein